MKISLLAFLAITTFATIPLDSAAKEQNEFKWLLNASGYEQALSDQEKTGDPVMVFVGAEWCPNCENFKHKVLIDEKVQAELAKIIAVKIDLDAGDKEKAITKSLGAYGLPVIVLLKQGQKEPITLDYSADPAEFIQILNKQLKADPPT